MGRGREKRAIREETQMVEGDEERVTRNVQGGGSTE